MGSIRACQKNNLVDWITTVFAEKVREFQPSKMPIVSQSNSMLIQNLNHFKDLSWLERLVGRNIFHLLLNLGLYLSLVVPLAEKALVETGNSPWKIAYTATTIIFILSGFGLVYHISGVHLRFWLMRIRIDLEYWLKVIGSKLGLRSEEESLARKHVHNTNLLTRSELISYLSKNENKFLQRLYDERLEASKMYSFGKENTGVTLILLALHSILNTNLYSLAIAYQQNHLQELWVMINPILFILLIWSFSEPTTEDDEYFYIPGNPVRHSKSESQLHVVDI